MMRDMFRVLMCAAVCAVVCTAWCASAGEYPNPLTYIPTLQQIEMHKKFFDDPRPYLTTYGPKQVVPKEILRQAHMEHRRAEKGMVGARGLPRP